MPLEKDILVQQEIFLGGQISNKHKIFQRIALMSSDYADLYFLVERMPEWEKQENEDKIMLEILELFGMIDFVRGCSELTRLSMIMGDTRGRVSVKGVMDELRKSRSDSQT
jgi:hypothetical protein